MLLIDDLLKAPGKAMFCLLEELARKAQEEWLDDDSVKQELQQIYALLDAGNISEKEFEAREQRLLDRLEQITRVKFRDKFSDTPTASGFDGPVIETGLSARAFSDALGVGTEASGSLVAESPSSLDNHLLMANKSSLGPDFFQALRPFLDLPGSSSAALQAPDPDLRSFRDLDLREVSAGLSAAECKTATSNIIDPLPPPVTDDPSPGQVEVNECPAPRESTPHSESSRTNANRGASPAQATDVKASPSISGNSATNAAIGFSGAVESAMQALSVTKLKPSSVISVVSCDDGWQVTVELIERKAVPDTNDLLGVYEVHVNKAGVVWRYERTRVRRRNDITR